MPVYWSRCNHTLRHFYACVCASANDSVVAARAGGNTTPTPRRARRAEETVERDSKKRWPRPARHASPRARAWAPRGVLRGGDRGAKKKKIGMDRVAGCVCRWKTVNWWWIETAGFLACGRKPDATPRAAARMWIVERRWV